MLRINSSLKYSLFILLLTCILSGQISAQNQSILLNEEISSDNIWVPSVDVLRSLLNECTKYYAYRDEYVECVAEFMKQNGATKKAIDFTRMMDGEAFLSAFFETGSVDVVKYITPFKGRNNESFLLVNGGSKIIDIDDPNLLTDNLLNLNDDYRALISTKPSLKICQGNHNFPGYDNLKDDGHRFVFTYDLEEDCTLRTSKYKLSVAFDFDAFGNFLGPTVLGVSEN